MDRRKWGFPRRGKVGDRDSASPSVGSLTILYTASDTGSGTCSKGGHWIGQTRRGFLAWEMKAYFAGANRRGELIKVGMDCKLRNF